MTTSATIKWNDAAIDNLKKALASQSFVKVGVLSDGKLHEGDTIGAAGLAAVHEFGSPSRKIPERSFLRSTLSNKKDDFNAWVKSNGDNIFKATVQDGGYSALLEKIGALWVGYVQNTFFTSNGGKWPKLSPRTIASRTKGSGVGAAKPLIDTGELINSITHEVVE